MIGIDVSKATLAVCLRLADSGIELDHEFPNTATGHHKLHAWLKKHGEQTGWACMESTGPYHLNVAQFLHQHRYRVSVVNPKRIKAYGESRLSRGKTDKADARLIAEFGEKETLPVWQPPAPERVALKDLQDRLDELEESLRQHRQRREHCQNPSVLASLEREEAFIKQEIEALKREQGHLCDKTPCLREEIELLCTIPGVGELTATRLVARIDISLFDHAASFAAFFGVTPREHSSGTSVHKKARMSKLGSKRLRTALYFPAMQATRYNAQVQALYDRLVAKGHPKKSALGAAMRKLAQQIYGVWSSRRPYDATHGLPSLESFTA